MEILLLRWLEGPRQSPLIDPPCIASAPLRRRQVGPAHAARDDILALVPHHAKKRVVRLDDPTPEVDNKDSDYVGVDKAPNLRLPLLEIVIEARVLERDRRLPSELFQDGNPSRCERMRRQRIFEEEGPGQ